MVGCTDVLSNCTYNISSLVTDDVIINNPAGWLQTLDGLVGNVIVISVLASVLLMLFLSMRRSDGVSSDSEAMSYASYITVIVGLFLFVIDTGTGIKLISWVSLFPFIVLAAISFFLNVTNRNF